MTSPRTNPLPAEPPRRPALLRWWRAWWRNLTPLRQDRLALLAPLVAVFVFLGAIVAAFAYLQIEESEREQETLQRDLEYAQQRVRLLLLERQEQLMRLARQLALQELAPAEFENRAEALVNQYPELQALTWIDPQGRIRASHAAPTLPASQQRAPGEKIALDTPSWTQAWQQRQAAFAQPLATPGQAPPLLQLLVPIVRGRQFGGVVLGEFSNDSLLRYGMPPRVLARYAVTLLDGDRQLLAGTPMANNTGNAHFLPWKQQRASEYAIQVSPVGRGLILRAQTYRTSLGVVGSGLFWLVGVLSVLTTWLLVATWRHTRRRLQMQQALVAETNFRRAMENSIATGMRALDLEGRITYVNAAFCQMTGWSAEELVGLKAPFPYWPDEERHFLSEKLKEQFSGKHASGGYKMRVKRKNGTLFDARLYVSPLIDAHGQQTGWMTSMTDITEPTRIREQLAAAHERFTIVLEALDAAVSVAPLGSEELLFANKLYRQWFGAQADGHLQLVAQAGKLPVSYQQTGGMDEEDGLMGLPADAITNALPDHAEIFLPELGKWLEVRSRYLSWVDGRLAQMVIASDITQRREAEEQAARQAERAQSVSRLVTMGEMASSLAHELNQPLTAISNYCNGTLTRIESGQLSEDMLRMALQKTAHQAQRAGQIIHHIRAFVKKSEPQFVQADVSKMVQEAIELAGIELRRHNVRLTHHVAARLPPVLADTILIEQVLINLLKNGAESIQQAQRPPAARTVELRVLPRSIEGNEVIEFAVQDSGKGLPPEMRERLFEAFYSTKQEGMGIGLNLCRSIVEAHQGRLQADNIYNGAEVVGCRFSFWLPIAKPAGIASKSVANVPSTRTVA